MEEWKDYRKSPWGYIPNHWGISSIKDETEVVTDYVANGSFASLAENVKYKSEKDYAVLIRLVDYNNQFKGDFVFIDKDAYDFLGKSKLYGDEIIISNVGANVGTVFKCPHLDFKMSLAPNSIMVKFKGNNDFYYYWLRSRFGQHMLQSIVTGSAQPKFNKTNFRDLLIPVPPISEQKSIASILKSLDDKIEVNWRINDNLEQQAQALFKSWFVDFEPFKNGEFVESELGMIPKGWRVKELTDIAEISKVSINPQKQPQIEFKHYSIPSYDDGMKPEIQLGEEIKSNKFVIKNKMTLFSKLNPRIKRVWFVDKLDDNSICSTEFVPYKAKAESKSSFLYSLINSQGFYDFVMSMVNGATGSHQRFHPEDSLRYKIAYNETYCSKYCEIATPIINKILDNREEARRLADLRDTLLPKLMSGELKVNEIEI